MNPTDPPQPNSTPQTPAPLLPIALAVCAGILIARYALLNPVLIAALLILSLLASGLAIFFFTKRHPRFVHLVSLLLVLGFAALAALRYYLVYHYFSPNHLIHYCRPDPRLASLRGTIVTEPYLAQPTGPFASYFHAQSTVTIFTLRCTAVQTPTDWRPAAGLALVTIDQPALHLRRGQHLQLDAWIAPRPRPQNPGQYDSADLHHAAGNLVSCRVRHSDAVTILQNSRAHPGLFARFQQKLQSLAHAAIIDDTHNVADPVSPPAALESPQNIDAFLAALLLGRRAAFPLRLNEIFFRTGTIHFLSVSGIHVACFVAFIWWLARLLRLPRFGCGLAALAAIALFLLIIPPRPPVLRAGILAATFALAYLTRRTTNTLNLLAFSAIIVLLWRPLDLFNPGFQLSFIVVLGLILFALPLYHYLNHRLLDPTRYVTDPTGLRAPVPLRPDPAEPLPLWRLLLRYILSRIITLLAVAAVAWLIGLPLVAFHFHRIALWGILASMILYPLVFLVLILGFSKLLLATLTPTLAGLLAAPLHALSQLTLDATDLLARLPAGNFNTASPPLWIIVLLYLILLALALALRRARDLLRFPLYALALWLVVFFWQVPFTTHPQLATSCHFLSVGHGAAVVVQLPDGQTLAYDAGSLSKPHLAAAILLPFLRHQGLQRLDALVLSHPDLDHYSAALELCQSFPVQTIYRTDYFQPQSTRDPVHLLLTGLEQLNLPLQTLHRRQSLPHFPDLPDSSDSLALSASATPSDSPPYRIDVLWPPHPDPDLPLSDNDTSLVLRIADPHGSVLLCGDIDIRAQQSLLQSESPQSLHADVLLLPHHGAVTPILPEFVKAVDPQLIINSGGFLSPRKLQNLHQTLPDYPILHTHQSGCISLHFTPTGLHLDTYNDK